mgnify:CR=1 FL=1
MRSGITHRWLRGSLFLTVLLVLLVESMFVYNFGRSYYNSVQQTMMRRFSSINGQLKMYTGDTAQKTAANRSVALRRMVEQFADKDKYEFMLLDGYGGVIASSSGTGADGIVVQDDFNKAQDAPDGVGVAIYRTASGETVMAVCSLVPYAAEDVAAMRLVTSLTLVQAQLKSVFIVSLIVVAAIAAFIFLGGVQRIAAVTEKVVPIMAAFYILGCIVILVINAKALPGALAQVFVLAFEPQAMAGGIAGVTVQQSMRFGVARGLFSNEAGLGSTPHAHALAKVECPQDQGAVAILGVFVDTFVVLTLTGLVLITSGLIPQGMTGTSLTQAAFSQAFGGFGPIFIAVCMFFFAFSTIIGWYFFGQSNFKALFGEKLLPVYSIIVVAFILVGSTLKVDLVWALADLFNGLMAVPNLLALLALAGVVVAIDRK